MVDRSVFYMCFLATMQLQINCTVVRGTFTGLIVWQIITQSDIIKITSFLSRYCSGPVEITYTTFPEFGTPALPGDGPY